MRYEFTDHEWAAIKPMLPSKPHGVPQHADFGAFVRNKGFKLD